MRALILARTTNTYCANSISGSMYSFCIYVINSAIDFNLLIRKEKVPDGSNNPKPLIIDLMPSLIHFPIAFKNFFSPIFFFRSLTKSQEWTNKLFVASIDVPATIPLAFGNIVGPSTAGTSLGNPG